MSSQLIADNFVSLAAFMGLIVMRFSLDESGNSGWINRRFRFVIFVLAVMLVSRVLHSLSGLNLFNIIKIIATSLIPLAMLILCEGLMRQHGPRFLKLWTLSGGIILVLLSPFLAYFSYTGFMTVLLAFMILSISAIGLWVVRREKSELSNHENQIVDRLLWSLLLIVPFTITDFRIGFLNSPVKLSGIAILLICWLSLSFNRIRVDRLKVIVSFLLFLLGSSIVTGVVSLMFGLDIIQSIQTGAILLSTALLIQVYIEARSSRIEDEKSNFLQYASGFEGHDNLQFLLGLQHNSLFADSLVLEESDLVDFDDHLRAYLQKKRVAGLPGKAEKISVSIREQVSWLLEKYSATHVLHVSDTPFRLLVVKLPVITTENDAELEFAVAQQIAILMSKVEAAK